MYSVIPTGNYSLVAKQGNNTYRCHHPEYYVIISFSFILAAAPAIFLVWYYYKQDSAKPEPKGLIIKTFFLGVASIVPAIILELLMGLFGEALQTGPLIIHFFKAFFIAGLCEEFCKLMVVKLFIYNRQEFDEVMDGIVYTVVAGLGFACFENIMYVMQGGIGLAFLRAFTAIPLHALTSGIMGYYVGKAKFDKQNETSLIIVGLIIAIVIHGVYDFVLFAIPELGYLPSLLIFPLLIGCFFFLKHKIKLAIKSDKEAGRVEQNI